MLNELQSAVAERIHKAITAQMEWIKQQRKNMTDAVLTGKSDLGFDIRQTCQALTSGEQAISALRSYFKSYVGTDYEEYCKGIEVEPVTTAEDRLLSAIKELLGK